MGVVVRMGGSTYLASIAKRRGLLRPPARATRSFTRRCVALILALLLAVGLAGYYRLGAPLRWRTS